MAVFNPKGFLVGYRLLAVMWEHHDQYFMSQSGLEHLQQ